MNKFKLGDTVKSAIKNEHGIVFKIHEDDQCIEYALLGCNVCSWDYMKNCIKVNHDDGVIKKLQAFVRRK